MKKELKLFVWEGVLCDWSCGMVCVLAHNLREAKKLVIKKDDCVPMEDLNENKPKVVIKPEAFITWGGG